jgi:hypothetical protein
MKTNIRINSLLLIGLLACPLQAPALEPGYFAGELIGQASPGGSPWEGDRGWITVVDGIGRDGKFGVRTAPSDEKLYRKAAFKLPQGSVESGIIKIAFDMQISSSGQGQAIGLTFGRDAEGVETGRGMRLIIQSDGKVKVITPDTAQTNKYVDQATDLSAGWVKVEVVLDYGTREATLTLDDSPVTTQPFLVEKGTMQDSRGTVEISSGGGEGAVVEFDNFALSEEKQ